MTTPLLLLRPDGARPPTERLSFLTDISTALDGTESRVQLRAYPRHSYTSQYTFLTSKARAERDMLRTADRVGFPLVMHQLPRGTSGAVGADAGIAASGQLLIVKRDGTTEFKLRGVQISDGEWQAAAFIAPYAEGWVDLSRQITHRSAGVSTSVLTFEVEGLDEVVLPWSGPRVGGKPVWPSRADWSSEVTESAEAIADAADFGHLRLRSIRYMRRAISVSLLLIGRPAIIDFRRLVYALGGANKPFLYRFEPDGIEKTWRLSSDDVSIDYLRNDLARVSLEFWELPA